VSLALSSAHFDAAKYEEFIQVLGMGRAERTATKFLERLAGAFKSTPEETRREAHDLINCAGLPGFHLLVEACAAIERSANEDLSRQGVLLEEARRAQAMARQTLVSQILPKLRVAA
jgi:hypothetical protein